MMKPLTAYLILFLGTIPAFGQNIQKTFVNEDNTLPIDSIDIKNINTGEMIQIPGTALLELGQSSSTGSIISEGFSVRLFPNPMPGEGTCQILVPDPGLIRIELISVSGKVRARFEKEVDPGIHSFRISASEPGQNLVRCTLGSGPSVSATAIFTGNEGHDQIQWSGIDALKSSLKTSQGYFLKYQKGDLLRFVCHSKNMRTLFTDSPTASGAYQVAFMECTDEEGMDYPVVSLGGLFWMAENLRFLPMVNSHDETSAADPRIYVYGYEGNDPDGAKGNGNFKTYGALYNWPASTIACPAGWRLPRESDWTWLQDFNQAVKSTGFDALAGGAMVIPGGFQHSGAKTGFWTSAEADPQKASGIFINFNQSSVGVVESDKESGLSVRCVRSNVTGEEPPAVNTYPVVEIKTTAALVQGHIVPGNSELPLLECGFCWSTDPVPDLQKNHQTATAQNGLFETHIENLTPATVYYVRAYATNSAGTGYGRAISFTTRSGGTFTDNRDGREYRYVTIGTQDWMEQNLAWLPAVKEATDISGTSERYYVYGYSGVDVTAAKNTSDFRTYGVLYNWPGALSACPAGWHLPTSQDWDVLIQAAGGTDIAGFHLKSVRGWANNGNESGNGDNTLGFTALPGGDLEGSGVFLNRGQYGSFWSSRGDVGSNAFMWLLDNFNKGAFLHSYPRYISVSVRCVRN
jgi:uncharacterized protein (TIGR02145 family)